MHPMLNIAVKAARNAAKTIVRFVDHLESVSITEKSRNDLVTEVDRLAEEEIIKEIRRAYPNHGILAEESGDQPGSEEYTWVVDPLDGTANFVHSFPQFAISIAVRHKNEAQVAVIYDPLRQELFTAAKGQGAQLDNRKIRVSERKKLDSALIGTGFPFRDSAHFKPYLRMFEGIFPQCADIRRAGAASLDLAYVAAGRLDGFWESSLKDWDMAAGSLIIREAGGIVSDYHGEDQYLDNGTIVAGNPKVHKALLDIIQASLE